MAYRQTPLATTTMPPGIGHIIGNELAERFSFYGMRAVLFVFMTTALRTHGGAADLMQEAEAREWVHLFIAGVYFTPMIGALLCDLWLGKYRTIMSLSLLYCLGHAVLALDHTRSGLAWGLGLIALGAGGIKPCVSAHVGDQFGQGNAHLLPRAFNWFYLSINIGAVISQLLTPWLLKRHGAELAFGVPGVLMALATLLFWLGRHRYAHVPAQPRHFLRELRSPQVLRSLAGLLPIFVLIAVFWSLFDQTSSAWISQGERMQRQLWGVEIDAAQLQAVNPFFILVLIPCFTLLLYPALQKRVDLTPLRRIGAGFVLTLASVALSAWIEERLQQQIPTSMGWQVLNYLVITCAEILISITALEFSYTQAPPSLKSVVMALDLGSVALGNFFTAKVNAAIANGSAAQALSGSAYWWFFLKVAATATILFMLVARFYRGRSYLQDEAV
jgi:POT family proton-dependent oligopeptide transporter